MRKSIEKLAEQKLTRKKGRTFDSIWQDFSLQAHPDHTCQSTDIQCILQYIALAQDVSVLTLGLQSQQALCRCSGASQG